MSIAQYEKAYTLCIGKIKNNIPKMPHPFRELPACTDGNYFNLNNRGVRDFFHIINWTTSFFTGMALLAYEETRDEALIKWVNSLYDLYYQKVFEHSQDTMHDLGFLYSLYSVALYKLTGDINNRRIALKAADELAKRFVLKGGYIRAWGRMDDRILETDPEWAKDHFYTQSKGLAIIDCMMNLPLLFWASEQTGNAFYHDIAVSHADMTLKYFIREDGSTYHAYRFDENGEPVKGCSYCGYADESYWARGTTWAIYGFAIAFGYTKDKRYLDAAKRIACQFIKNLDSKGLAVWDFRLPGHMPPNVDTSASAIAACGFMQILEYEEDKLLAEYAEKILMTLTGEEYTDYDPQCPGTLKHQNGNETYTIFGDYFYMEALSRRLGKFKMYW